MITNYRQNKKIESVENNVSKINNILGLQEKKLTNDELTVISYFIEKSIKLNKSVDLIPLFSSSFKDLDIDEDIEDIIINLQSNGFLIENKLISDPSYYNIDFSVFVKSNLIQSIFEDSISYSELFRIVVNCLYDNFRKERMLKSNILMKKSELNEFLLNPILFHLDSIGVIKFGLVMRDSNLITPYFNIDKPNLYKLYRELNDSSD